MKNSTADLIFVVSFVLIVAVSAVGLHEYTHMYLFNKAGCDTELNVMDQGDPRTAMAVASVSAECSGTAESLQRLDMKQSTVEAVGYQTIPLYIMLAAVMAFVIVSNRRRGNTDKAKTRSHQDDQIVLRTSEDDLREILKEAQDNPRAEPEVNATSNPTPIYSGSSD
ncbi:MAG: hypothetical protein J07AB43_09640 [Candidatus Nanosalina sp. J07AB43]|nr:MAG: hypothetical protein J07AB43_09640 [Candidatus Nanosalina sp. J07AB43]